MYKNLICECKIGRPVDSQFTLPLLTAHCHHDLGIDGEKYYAVDKSFIQPIPYKTEIWTTLNCYKIKRFKSLESKCLDNLQKTRNRKILISTSSIF